MSDDQVKIKKQPYDNGNLCCSDDEHYPWGTSFSVTDELVDELDVGGMEVGDIVEVRGYAFVESKSEWSDSDGQEKRIGFQLTSLKVKREAGDRIEQLYGPEK